MSIGILWNPSYRIPNKDNSNIILKRTKEEFYSPGDSTESFPRTEKPMHRKERLSPLSKSYHRLSLALIILILRSMTQSLFIEWFKKQLFAQDIERNYNTNGTKHREARNADDATCEGVVKRNNFTDARLTSRIKVSHARMHVYIAPCIWRTSCKANRLIEPQKNR